MIGNNQMWEKEKRSFRLLNIILSIPNCIMIYSVHAYFINEYKRALHFINL